MVVVVATLLLMMLGAPPLLLALWEQPETSDTTLYLPKAEEGAGRCEFGVAGTLKGPLERGLLVPTDPPELFVVPVPASVLPTPTWLCETGIVATDALGLVVVVSVIDEVVVGGN